MFHVGTLILPPSRGPSERLVASEADLYSPGFCGTVTAGADEDAIDQICFPDRRIIRCMLARISGRCPAAASETIAAASCGTAAGGPGRPCGAVADITCTAAGRISAIVLCTGGRTSADYGYL